MVPLMWFGDGLAIKQEISYKLQLVVELIVAGMPLIGNNPGEGQATVGCIERWAKQILPYHLNIFRMLQIRGRGVITGMTQMGQIGNPYFMPC